MKDYLKTFPEKIYLVLGEVELPIDFNEECLRDEILWCEDAQFAFDVPYIRADLVNKIEKNS